MRTIKDLRDKHIVKKHISNQKKEHLISEEDLKQEAIKEIKEMRKCIGEAKGDCTSYAEYTLPNGVILFEGFKNEHDFSDCPSAEDGGITTTIKYIKWKFNISEGELNGKK